MIELQNLSILLVDLITRGQPNPDGKILIIGGGIANFTNVAVTFKGIIRALKEYKAPLINHQVRIFVRRGGPNYQEAFLFLSIPTFKSSPSPPILFFNLKTRIRYSAPELANGPSEVKCKCQMSWIIP